MARAVDETLLAAARTPQKTASKQPAAPAKKATPAKKAATPVKKAAPAKKTATPAKKTATPVKTAVPAKKAATPVKKTATPAKKTATPVKKTATPAKKTATPVKKAAPAKKAATPVKKAAPVRKAAPPKQVTATTKAAAPAKKAATKKVAAPAATAASRKTASPAKKTTAATKAAPAKRAPAAAKTPAATAVKRTVAPKKSAPAAPTQPAASEAASSARWISHPWAAAAVRLCAVAVPVGASVVSGVVSSRLIHRPSTFGHEVMWWLLVLFISTVVLFAVDRLARRLLPLATLLKLSMAFPDRAPSRFAIAARAGTTRGLQEQLRHAEESGVADEPARAAERILTLVGALGAHDRRTRGHSERVRAFNDLIAKELRLPQHDRDRLRWAALLHDIGKLHVSPRILNKPKKPTEKEWAILKSHPERGARITAPLMEWLGPWGQTIEQHHERWDGAGYPHGLSGSDICLGARIVAVADAYEVMTAPRPYSRPVSAATARAELARCADAQFDPEVVRAFLNISIGSLRKVIGPIAWLAQLPLIGATPRLEVAVGNAGRQLATATATATGTGVLAVAISHAPAPQQLASYLAANDTAATASASGHVHASTHVHVGSVAPTPAASPASPARPAPAVRFGQSVRSPAAGSSESTPPSPGGDAAGSAPAPSMAHPASAQSPSATPTQASQPTPTQPAPTQPAPTQPAPAQPAPSPKPADPKPSPSPAPKKDDPKPSPTPKKDDPKPSPSPSPKKDDPKPPPKDDPKPAPPPKDPPKAPQPRH